jgi:general secretion pathway protein B
MSFILDALKKSENERQRQIGPSLADVPARRKRNERPWWAFAIAALLVVNLGVLAIVLLRSGGEADAKPAPMPEPTVGSAPSISVPRQVAPPPVAPAAPSTQAIAAGPPARSLADEALPETSGETSDPALPDLSGAATVPPGPAIVRPIDAPSVAPLRSGPAYEPQVPSNEILPTHGSLVAGGTSLPDLRLDIHVYSPTPAERFVYVNMRKYTEGQALSEGPSVERITSDGVVLNQQGLRFLLPRQ